MDLRRGAARLGQQLGPRRALRADRGGKRVIVGLGVWPNWMTWAGASMWVVLCVEVVMRSDNTPDFAM